MQIIQTILFAISVLIAIVFTLLVFFTGKGDAMSGGSGVRTTFKGKASFDDIISRLTFILGISFMSLMLALDIIGSRMRPAESSDLMPITAAPGGQQSQPEQPKPQTPKSP